MGLHLMKSPPRTLWRRLRGRSTGGPLEEKSCIPPVKGDRC